MLTKRFFKSTLLLIIVLVCGCSHHKTDRKQIITDSVGQITAVRLKKGEIERAGIKFGSIIEQEHEKTVLCHGHLVVPPANKIIINAPAAGKITKICCHTGQYIHEGTIIAYIQNSDFITLQQEYLEMKNQMDYLREEYTRQGELTVENATSLKKMQIAKRDYQSAELKLNALQLQLELLGIRSDSLKYDGMSPDIPIKAFGSGTVTKIKINSGTYIEKGEIIFELIKTNQLLAALKVPESISHSLQSGQSVTLFMADDSLSPKKAKLVSISYEINPDDQCATVYAGFQEPTKQRIPGMSVTAIISLGKDTLRLLNAGSLAQNASCNYLFFKEKGVFKRMPVTKGNTFGERTEIKNFPTMINDSLVIAGSAYLNAFFDPF
jgi:cobalt-zinc-cadmium efflux system membrane fusion protein